jgi:LPXTG-motif cell wall-anchored protein
MRESGRLAKAESRGFVRAHGSDRRNAMKGVGMRLPYAARFVGFVLAALPMLAYGTIANAQSREDQYGSPTDPVEFGNTASGALGVLPETGGTLILFVGAALIIAGTAVILLRRRSFE